MKRLMLAVSVVLFVDSSALAQDAGQIGITMGYPAAVGIIWHVTDRVAVRPSIAFSTGSTDNTSLSPDLSFLTGTTLSDEISSTIVTAGVSGLFYFGQWDKLRAYVSPGYAYGRVFSNSGSTFFSDDRHMTFQVTGSFGAHYQFHHRFAVFGETGLGYNHSHTTFSSSLVILTTPGLNVPAPVTRTAETNSHNWSTRTGAGVIFYFK
jgi:Outer membrane protein beta-barrel domain